MKKEKSVISKFVSSLPHKALSLKVNGKHKYIPKTH